MRVVRSSKEQKIPNPEHDRSHVGLRRPATGASQIVDLTTQATSPSDDDRAEQLYLRYGARPWALLPETTREHFRKLVAAGIDGQGLPLDQTGS